MKYFITIFGLNKAFLVLTLCFFATIVNADVKNKLKPTILIAPKVAPLGLSNQKFKKPNKYRYFQKANDRLITTMSEVNLSLLEPEQIDIEHAAEIFNQCSRETPLLNSAVWLPTKVQISQFNKAITRAVSNYKNTKKNDRVTKVFRGQYVGFHEAGVSYIYGAFNEVVDWMGNTELLDLQKRHIGRANIWCDGNSWGVVYDPANDLLYNLIFNGYMPE